MREVLLGVGGWSCWTSVEERPSRLEEVGPGWRLEDLFGGLWSSSAALTPLPVPRL